MLIKTRFFKNEYSKILFNLPRQRRQKLIGWLKHNINYSIDSKLKEIRKEIRITRGRIPCEG